MRSFEKEIAATQQWFDSPRFAGIVRLYTARQVVEQRGTIATDYIVAREAAAAFYDRLRQLFAERKSITTFGPYSPGQVVTMKRMGIESTTRISLAMYNTRQEIDATVAALKKLRGSELLGRKQQIVLLITGHGLKDVEAARQTLRLPASIEPTVAAL